DARGSPNETTPLVGDTQSECSDSDSSRDESAAEETRELLSFTLPVSAAYLLSYLAQATSMVFLGHLGAMELAAGCLAITFGNVAGFSMLIGLATAADTLCAQAWTMKSDDPHAVGEILQQSLLVMFVACVPTCLAFWFAGPILLALGQDKDVVALASEFLRILIPAVPAFGAFESIKRFLQSQGVASAYTAVIFATTILNVPLTYVLVWRALGFVGAPIAIAAVAWANLLLILLYARFVDGAQGFGGWSREAVRWRALKAYLKLALPGVLQVASEWWTFEVLAIMAGLLGSRELAVQSVVTTITSLIFMLPLGLSVSTTTRVAQKLGANRPQRSQMASLCGLGLGSAFGLVAMAVLLVFRHQLGGLLTSDPDVIAAVGDVLLVAAFYELADAINCVAAGVLRGVAATGYAAAAAFVGYYVVGLPLSGVLAFGPPALGLRGIWIGIT
ncbi:mate-domain-containing protein, partial [Hyaloraphidium curvatum]